MTKAGMAVATTGCSIFVVAFLFASNARPALYWVMLGSALVMAVGGGMIVRSWFANR